MNVDEQHFVQTNRHSGKLSTAFLVLLAIDAGRAAAPPQKASLAVGIVASRDAGGNLVIPHGECFEVGITNLSDQPIKIWEEKCQQGNRSLTFRVKIGDGDASVAQKRDVPKAVDRKSTR